MRYCQQCALRTPFACPFARSINNSSAIAIQSRLGNPGCGYPDKRGRIVGLACCFIIIASTLKIDSILSPEFFIAPPVNFELGIRSLA